MRKPTVRHGVKADIKIVKEFAESKNGKLLTTEYKNMLTKMDWQCSEGHEFSTTFNHVKNRKQWCPICGREKANNTFKSNNSDGKHSRKISAGHQNIDLKDWKEFVAVKNKKKWKKERGHFRYHNELEYKLKLIIRYRAKRAVETINGAKNISREEMMESLGCTLEELKKHLESQFQEGMSWNNWAVDGWHIDHIKPLAKFNLIDPEEQKKACHYTNLQPLWAKDNLSKGDKHECE